MSLSRRKFLQMLAVAGLAGCAHGKRSVGADLYDVPPFGNLTPLHLADAHAQLLPTYFREPSVNSASVVRAAGRRIWSARRCSPTTASRAARAKRMR